MKYDKRITVFLDILGFKQIIRNTEDKNGIDNEDKIAFLEETILKIRELLDIDNANGHQAKSKQITQFSDSIVISFKENEESEVFYTLSDIQTLIINLTLRGIICRGGISYGKLIHNDKMIFGPALVEAYETESKAALYPRIILDKTIIDIGKKHHAIHHGEIDEKLAIKKILNQDTDDMFYIDYFSKAQGELDDPEYDMPTYIEKLREIIEQGIKDGKKAPDIKVKYNWMKNKFNSMVRAYTRAEFISMLQDQDLKDYYSDLKLIK
jgi:hypothetical protein